MRVEWLEDPENPSPRTPYDELQEAMNDIFMRYLKGDLTEDQDAAVTEYLRRNECPECGR